MVILKTFRGSTLMETLVATVLIIVVFMLASMILNNLFSNTIKHNTYAIETQLNELEYLVINNKLELPYSHFFDKWEIRIKKQDEFNNKAITLEAIHNETKKQILKTIY